MSSVSPFLDGAEASQIWQHSAFHTGYWSHITEWLKCYELIDGWMHQAYSRLSTTHGHITDCKLLVRMYWTRLVLVRPAASLYIRAIGPVN